MAAQRYFSKATFQFLNDLKVNNTRDWFADNKHRYEDHLKDPALRLIEAFGPEPQPQPPPPPAPVAHAPFPADRRTAI